ncbi:MAG TPA: glycogen/starch/alpha-glucan phosphorylase, partial [Thermoanaerobaculia bacterium]|nr:glycogen/starch/alpha-glucan phosphorylase [Thermoanaerobaculia bacterium]
MSNTVSRQRTIPKPPPGGLDPDSIVEAFALRMMYSVARDQYTATDLDAFHAIAYAVRDRVMERWFATQDTYYRADAKRVYYLSLEFLLGRLLVSNIVNLGARSEHVEAMSRLGFELDSIARCESDAGLGNGGLGRLAACFIEAASTLDIPFYGYGIRYEYGIFRQRIEDGAQSEAPDNWLRYGNPWEVPRPDVLFPVKFYGRTEPVTDDHGHNRYRWTDTEDVYAMAYDVGVPGFGTATVNSLRLWAAKSSREFDLGQFNAGAYVAAVEDKNRTENISKVLYPPDDQYAGRELRLKQQYFFTSATMQDVIRRFKKSSSEWEELPDKVAIQLNDTHPAIAIPEMMRILVDQEEVEWDRAWWICQRLFAYTNHTVLPEALETWPRALMAGLLPRHMQIIEEIDRRFRAALMEDDPSNVGRVRSMAIVDDEAGTVRMTNLAIVGSHSVNGVAMLHTAILKNRVFAGFHQFFPRKFNNKTNGVTPRRWLLQCNPQLSELITGAVGTEWPRRMTDLQQLEVFAEDAGFRQEWSAVKAARKEIVAHWLRNRMAVDINVESIFDVQIKRIHEYKRQLLNAMHALALYHRIHDGGETIVPRTIIFAGKAAPSYRVAKLIIRLIHDIAALVQRSPRVSAYLNVVFVPNYDVTTAEMLFPATELSEQISTAGMEASGTGCMKAVMNGAVIIGTLDGANIEIRADVEAGNIFVFGKTAEEIAGMRESGYDPGAIIASDLELGRVLATIGSLGGGVYQPLVDLLTQGDRHFLCADFRSYVETQRRAAETWLARDQWTRMSILNTARSAYFSADRTVAEYARDIWRVQPVKV